MKDRTIEATEGKISVLFVCLGNICRSPLAEGVFRSLVAKAGLQDHFVIRSAGTGGWHVGGPADERMRTTAQRYGVSLDDHGAYQIAEKDLETFEYVLVMDRRNLEDVRALDSAERHSEKIKLFRDFDPEPGDRQVPDPYYGGQEGFDAVYRMVDRTSRALLEHLLEEHRIRVDAT